MKKKLVLHLKDMYINNLERNSNFPKFAYNFPGEKVNFSLTDPTHTTIHSFCKTLLSS